MSEDSSYDVTQDKELARAGAIRCISSIIMVVSLVMAFVMGIGFNNSAFAVGFVVVAVIATIVGCYFMFIAKDVDFFTYDFGFFSTEIHKVFVDKFEEVPFDDELNLPDCSIRKFVNSVGTGEKKYEFVNRWQGNRHIEQYEMISTECVFEVTYIEFATQEQCLENEKKIKEHDFKKDLSYVSVNHFTSKNVHIVFQCCSVGFSRHLNKKITFMDDNAVALANNTYSTSSLVKRAAKKVKLK